MDANDATTTIEHLFAPATPQVSDAGTANPAMPAQGDATPTGAEVQPQSTPQLQPQPGQAQPPQGEAPRMVPLPELMETRRRAQAAEEDARAIRQQNQQLIEAFQRLAANQPQTRQPQPQPIDPEIDPAGYARELEMRLHSSITALDQKYQGALQNMQLNASESNARGQFGNDVVDAAFEAAQAAGYIPTFVSRADPYGELVDGYQGQRIKQEIGTTDLTAYRAQIEAETRAKILAELKAGTGAPTNLPPSLASATRASNAPEVVQDTGDFFKSMFDRRTQKG